METRRKAALLVTGIALILTAGNAKAQYEGPTVTTDDDGDGPYRVETETMYKIGAATGSANGDPNGGLASCAANSDTWAAGDSAHLNVYGWGHVEFSWEWTGTPGMAPGGSLYWEHDGEGDADAQGGTSGQAASFAIAYGRTWVCPDIDPYPSWADGTAWGYVTGNNLAIGEASADGSPEVPSVDGQTEDPGYGSFHYVIDWSIYYDDVTSIPSGTSNFYVEAQADCQCESDSDSTSAAEAWGDTESSASILAYAEFTSN